MSGFAPGYPITVGQAQIRTATNSQTGTGGGDVIVTMDAYSFMPDWPLETTDKPKISMDYSQGVGAPGDPDIPRHSLTTINAGVDYGVYWRSVSA